MKMQHIRNVLFTLIFLFVSSNIFAMNSSDEQALINDVASTKAKYGEGSDEHVIAYAKLIDNYLNNSQKRDLAKSSLADFYQILKARYGANAQILDEPASKLGEMYLNDSEYLAAIPVLEDYLNNLKLDANKNMSDHKPLPIPYAVGLVQYNLIRAYIETKRYMDAEDLLRDMVRDIDLRNDINGDIKNQDLLAKTYEISAEGEVKQFKFDKALEYAKKSLEITKQTPKFLDADLMRRTYLVATLLKQTKRDDEAKSFERESKKIGLEAEYKTNGMSVDEVVELAKSYNDTNQTDQAIEAYKLAEKKLLAEPNPDEHLLTIVYANLTIIYGQTMIELVNNNFQLGHVAALSVASNSTIVDANKYAQKNLDLLIKSHLLDQSAIKGSAYMLAIIQFLSMKNKDDANQNITNLHFILETSSNKDLDVSLDSNAEMLLCLTYAYIDEDDLSILWGKEAVNTLQSFNDQKLALASPPQVKILASRHIYEMVSTLLIRQGRVLEAQQILQMLKENELYENMRSVQDDPRKLRAELTDFEKIKFAKFYQLRTQQVALIGEHNALEDKKERKVISNNETSRLIEINDNLFPKLASEMGQYLKQLEVDLAAKPSKAVQNNISISKEATNLSKVINQLAKTEPNANAVGVQYYVAENILNIIITTPNAPPIAHQVKLDRAELYENIKTISLQMQNPQADAKFYLPALNKLYNLLISPIELDLKSLSAKTLMLSLDDQLRLLPFAALQSNDNRYLIQDYTLALYNEAAYQALEKPSAKNWRIAAMGLSQSVDGLPALTAVPDELSGIVKNNGLTGDRYLDAQFTRNQFMSVLNASEMNPYNVLHIASHFELKPGDPSKSSLYMGDGTRLSLQEMSSIPLNFNHFDLVTYSACQTAAAGGRDATGQEMESLSARTQRQGAQAVIATLWKVSDQSTAKLMQDYYSQRNQSLNKAEALRVVQLNMALGKAGNKNWKSPHHWAGFVVSGNWR